MRRSSSSSRRCANPRRTRSSTIRLAAGSDTWTHLGGLLERELARLVLEVVEQLDLGQRQLERADRLEQVGVAVLVEEHDQRVQIGGEAVVCR